MTDAQRRSKARSAYQKAKRKKQLHNRIFIIILIAVVVLIAIGAIVRIRHNHAKTTYVKADQITDTLYNDNRIWTWNYFRSTITQDLDAHWRK